MINILLSRSILGEPEMVQNLSQYILPTHQVLIVAFSFFKEEVTSETQYDALYEKGGTYYDKMIAMFSSYGISENQISWIHYYKDDTASAIQKIKEADILYFPGGAPDLMMKRIHEFGIQESLEQHQGIYIGSSAGAMIQFEDYHISKDHDYKRFSYEHGLNLLKGFSIEVHYDRKKKQKSGMHKVWRAYRHDIYAIPDDGCMVIDRQRTHLLGSAVKIYNQKGKM
jgi:peptidase E